MLEVEGLKVSVRRSRKTYVPILDGISFSIAPGETLGVVGESGCGKSLTALSLMKLLPDNMKMTGSIRFDGQEISTYSKDKMRRIRGNQVSMIFQEPLTSLNPLHTIGQQIMEPMFLHTQLNAKQRRNRAIELLNDVGIPRANALVDEYPHQLSGGMRQRVMIAMAMACQPKLLIADEPTTALDVTVQAQILELMQKLKDEYQMAVMMITHDLGVIAEVCDRVMVMYAGRVVEEAKIYNLFDKPHHPYTVGLMASIPKIEEKVDVLGSIPGTVPVPGKMPNGCRFADRCSDVMDICRQESPRRVEIARNHHTSCWLYAADRISDEANDVVPVHVEEVANTHDSSS